MTTEIHTFRSKVRLYKFVDHEWVYGSSGNIDCNPIQVGDNVWVGSISSRTGYRTSAVTKVENINSFGDIDQSVYFETESGSRYCVFSIGNY